MRAANTLVSEFRDGSACLSCSEYAVINGSYLELPAPATGFCWAVWAWDEAGHSIQTLSCDFDLGQGQEVYVALADYSTGSWQIYGPLSNDAQLPLDEAQHMSPSGMVYCAALTCNGCLATARSLTLTADDNNQPPLADLAANPLSGNAPLDVSFDAAASSDNDGVLVDFEWDLNANGQFNETGHEADAKGLSQCSFSFDIAGTHMPCVRVTDNGGLNSTASVEINVAPANQPPVAVLDAQPAAGVAPLLVNFDASSSNDGDGSLTDYEWDFDGNGSFGEPGPEADQHGNSTAIFTFMEPGEYSSVVRVTDDDGGQDTERLLISAEPPPYWVHTWGGLEREAGLSIDCATDGSFYVVGETDTFGVGTRDVLVMKFSADGLPIWQRTWGGVNDNSAAGVKVGPGGDIFVTANTRDSNNVFWAAFLRFDPSGGLVWQRKWGVSNDDSGLGEECLAVDAAGHLYSAGYAWRPGGMRPIQLKIDADGNLIWQASYALSGTPTVSTVAAHSDGTFYVSGTLNTASNGTDLYLAQFDTDGVLQWETQMGTVDADLGPIAKACSTGGLYLAGSILLPQGGVDGMLTRLDTGGNISAAVRWGGLPEDKDSCAFTGLQEAQDGTVFLSGTANRVGNVQGPTLLVSFDSNLQLLSQNGWGFPTFISTGGNSLVLGADQRPVVCGSAPNIDGAGWSALAGVSSSLSLTVADPDGTLNSVTGTLSDADGQLTSPQGSLDEGGGDTDLLVVQALE